MQSKRQTVFTLAAAGLFLAGALVMAYPVIHGSVVDYTLSHTAADFLSRVEPPQENATIYFTRPVEPEEDTPREHPALWTDMCVYNAWLQVEQTARLVDSAAYAADSFILADYGLEDEVFGVLSIPDLELEMPIYLGASQQHMADGAAVLTETSIPIGGEGSNAVIAGHRGWYGASYFLHVPELEVGATVTVRNLWETLTYKVVGTEIIAPNDSEKILIQPGKDMLTLMTCHPPASGGKQRFLVYCERAE